MARVLEVLAGYQKGLKEAPFQNGRDILDFEAYWGMVWDENGDHLLSRVTVLHRNGLQMVLSYDDLDNIITVHLWDDKEGAIETEHIPFNKQDWKNLDQVLFATLTEMQKEYVLIDLRKAKKDREDREMYRHRSNLLDILNNNAL